MEAHDYSSIQETEAGGLPQVRKPAWAVEQDPISKIMSFFFNKEILNVDWVQVLEGKHLKGQQCIYHKVGGLLQSPLWMTFPSPSPDLNRYIQP